MKYLLLSLLLATPLFAQDASPELMENSDMADGTTHWHGSVKIAGADSTTNLVSGQNNAKGITVDLHPTTWTAITQPVRGLHVRLAGRNYTLGPVQVVINYQTSPEFSLSTKDADYTDIGPNLGFETTKMRGQPGQAIAFINYPITQLRGMTVIRGQRAAASYITPKTDQQPQIFTSTLHFSDGQTTRDLTFCLAFPPGTGSVTITKISVTELPVESPH